MNVDEYGWARRDGCPGLTEAARALRNRVSRRATDDDRPPPSTFPMTPAAREAVTEPQQLSLVPAPPRLTPRQEAALEFIRACGPDGATATEIGDHLGGHPAYNRSNGITVAKALKKHGVIRQRRGGIYVTVDATSEPETAQEWDGTGTIPYGHFPEGF